MKTSFAFSLILLALLLGCANAPKSDEVTGKDESVQENQPANTSASIDVTRMQQMAEQRAIIEACVQALEKWTDAKKRFSLLLITTPADKEAERLIYQREISLAQRNIQELQSEKDQAERALVQLIGQTTSSDSSQSEVATLHVFVSGQKHENVPVRWGKFTQEIAGQLGLVWNDYSQYDQKQFLLLTLPTNVTAQSVTHLLDDQQKRFLYGDSRELHGMKLFFIMEEKTSILELQRRHEGTLQKVHVPVQWDYLTSYHVDLLGYTDTDVQADIGKRIVIFHLPTGWLHANVQSGNNIFNPLTKSPLAVARVLSSLIDDQVILIIE